MKKETVKNQKQEAIPTKTAKRSASRRTDSKQVKAVAAVKDVPEIIEQPTEQQPVPQDADAVAITPPPESAILQDGTEQAEVASAIETEEITEQPSEPQTADTVKVTITKESKVLRERLGLNGYITETVKLSSTVDVLGSKAEGVVFARQIEGADRVLLHIILVNDNTKRRSIVSSKQKVPLPEWQAITESLAAMSITWRDRELKRVAK